MKLFKKKKMGNHYSVGAAENRNFKEAIESQAPNANASPQKATGASLVSLQQPKSPNFKSRRKLKYAQTKLCGKTGRRDDNMERFSENSSCRNQITQNHEVQTTLKTLADPSLKERKSCANKTSIVECKKQSSSRYKRKSSNAVDRLSIAALSPLQRELNYATLCPGGCCFVYKKELDIRRYYKIGPVLGYGAFGQVRECINKSTNEVFAVKVIERTYKVREYWSADAMFYREVEYLRSMKHPNILHIHGNYEDRHFLYAVIGLCRGGELFKKIVKKKAFNENMASILCQEMLLSIDYLHDKNIVHRDIKAENFLFKTNSTSEKIVLIDFGMSSYIRSITNDDIEDINTQESVTETSPKQSKSSLSNVLSKLRSRKSQLNFDDSSSNVDDTTPAKIIKNDESRYPTYLTDICGSPHYLAPELLHRKYDKAIDMWSLGVVIYLMLYGQYPFEGSDTQSIIKDILNKDIDYSSSQAIRRCSSGTGVRPSDSAINFVSKLLERDVTKRLTAKQALQHEWIAKFSQEKVEKNIPISLIQNANKTICQSKIIPTKAEEKRRNGLLLQLQEEFDFDLNHTVRGCKKKHGVVVLSSLLAPRRDPEYIRNRNRIGSSPSRMMTEDCFKLRNEIKAQKKESQKNDVPKEDVVNPDTDYHYNKYYHYQKTFHFEYFQKQQKILGSNKEEQNSQTSHEQRKKYAQERRRSSMELGYAGADKFETVLTTEEKNTVSLKYKRTSTTSLDSLDLDKIPHIMPGGGVVPNHDDSCSRYSRRRSSCVSLNDTSGSEKREWNSSSKYSDFKMKKSNLSLSGRSTSTGRKTLNRRNSQEMIKEFDNRNVRDENIVIAPNTKVRIYRRAVSASVHFYCSNNSGDSSFSSESGSVVWENASTCRQSNIIAQEGYNPNKLNKQSEETNSNKQMESFLYSCGTVGNEYSNRMATIVKLIEEDKRCC